MKTKKILSILGVCVLSSALLVPNNAQANYPQNYHGASASGLSINAEGTASYEGNIVTIPTVVKEDLSRNFKFDDLSELYFIVSLEKSEKLKEVDATVTPVNQQTGLVNLSFDVSQMELDKPYRMSIATETMFGNITEPEDIIFKMDDKLVTISSNGLVVVTKATESEVKNNEVKEADKLESKKDNKSEESATPVELQTDKQTNVSKSQSTHKSVKTLPETSAVK